VSIASRIRRLEQAGRVGELHFDVLWQDDAPTSGLTPCRDPRHGPRCCVDRDDRHVVVLSWDPSDA
jgi:hypothetical protein